MHKKSTKANAKGKNTFHPKRINWSYRYRGKIPRTTTKRVIKNIVLSAQFTVPGTHVKGIKSKNGCHPPKNKSAVINDIKIILLYSAKKKSVNPTAEYSTLYPETNSASASGKSKGCRLVSANALIKKRRNTGNKGIASQTFFWLSTILEKFNDPTTRITDNITAPKETSYEIICAAERNPPKNAYFELLDHPAIITVCTPNEEIAKTNKSPKLKSANTAPSPTGITDHPAIAKPKENTGAKRKIIVFELFGKIDSLSKSFNPSAIACKSP